MRERSLRASFSLIACSLALASAGLAASPPAPILDMHLHARHADHYGSSPPPMCTPFASMPYWDQSKPIEEGLTFGGKAPCAQPVAAAATDEAVLRDTVAAMERRNVYGVLGGEPGLVARWMAAAPGRFIPGLDFELQPGKYYAHEPAGGPLSAEEIRGLHERGAVEVLAEVLTSPEGIAPDDPRLEPYWAMAEQVDLPVGIHIGPAGPGEAYFTGARSFRARLQSALTLEEVLLRHPRLRVYVMHAGYPLLDDMRAMLFAHPQLYVEVGSIVYTEPRAAFWRYLQGLVEAGYGDRVMFGSDQMVWPGVIEPAIAAIEQAPFLTATQKRDILYNNAARFLRLPPAEIARQRGESPPRQ